MSKPSGLFTSYTDAASTYWPPGWNFQRYAHATPSDNPALSDEERAKIQAGLDYGLTIPIVANCLSLMIMLELY
ncbi:hypothetical protein J4E86_007952 [Alternaria arbusti]|uniref:uncharacterized protein n=1 Tax=Alternaria arbusti TaxID=232088 RepID=UPI00221EC136|nr:uncharacterized protein J4E86_007952 [Alternaria arbusti]KAI4948604.1 hypothetical protein J4E86_007952 [Alternaria arbusti]